MRSLGRALPVLEPGMRAVVVGPTGSGKSELIARQMVMPLHQRVIIISPKCKFDLPMNPRFREPARTIEELAQQISEDTNAGFPHRVYRLFAASEIYASANIGKINDVLKWVWDLGDTCVVLDDAYRVFGSTSSQEVVEARLPYYIANVTQGRDPKRITTVTAPQRAHNMPLIAFSESDIRVVFYMRDESDQKRMEQYCGPIPWDALAENDYSFVWATDKGLSEVIRLDLQLATA